MFSPDIFPDLSPIDTLDDLPESDPYDNLTLRFEMESPLETPFPSRPDTCSPEQKQNSHADGHHTTIVHDAVHTKEELASESPPLTAPELVSDSEIDVSRSSEAPGMSVEGDSDDAMSDSGTETEEQDDDTVTNRRKTFKINLLRLLDRGDKIRLLTSAEVSHVFDKINKYSPGKRHKCRVIRIMNMDAVCKELRIMKPSFVKNLRNWGFRAVTNSGGGDYFIYKKNLSRIRYQEAKKSMKYPKPTQSPSPILNAKAQREDNPFTPSPSVSGR